MAKEMKIKLLVTFILFALAASTASSKTNPKLILKVSIKSPNGEEFKDTYSGSAPAEASFSVTATDATDWKSHHEWRFYNELSQTPYLIRYEEDTNYTFTTSGSFRVVLYSVFTQDNDTIIYESDPIIVSIAESKLEMPNAFSPNDDGHNDIYKARDGYQSIVEFHAYIFNRWGQKLYEWTNINDGWNGKFHGQDVKEGVYFCLVKAKGSDGKIYNIKTDVNLLRGYNETTESSNKN